MFYIYFTSIILVTSYKSLKPCDNKQLGVTFESYAGYIMY